MAALDILKKLLGRANQYETVFSSVDGRWVMNDILLKAGILETLSPPYDLSEIAHREGRRALALEILGNTRMNKSAIAQKLQELERDRLETSDSEM